MKKRASRRRFLGVVAATSAAALIAPVQALAQAAESSKRKGTAAAAKTPKPTPGGRRVASPAEVEKLKGFTDDALKAIRAFPLPAGSSPAFVFRPLPAKRRKGSSRAR